MAPVRIKYWGLFWLSRQGYLLFNGLGWAGVIMLIVAAYSIQAVPPFRWPWEPLLIEPGGMRPFVINHFYDFVGLGMLAQLVDACVFYRCIATKEAAQRAQGAGTEPIDSH